MEDGQAKENAAAAAAAAAAGYNASPVPASRRTTGAELPMESSPYVIYEDVEDYKMQGYGVQGHQPPVDKPGGGGGTDAPTLSGSRLSRDHAEDAIKQRGVP